jgi:4a-hydroxytetrahydrobiopterin dehydratase
MFEDLAQMRCSACCSNGPRLTGAEVKRLMLQVPKWNLVEWDGVQHLERTYRLHSFARALAFTDDVEELAAEERCEPVTVIEVSQGWVTVIWWTDKIIGLHQNDFIMAAKTDLAYSSSGWPGGYERSEEVRVMPRYSVETKQSPEEAIKKAIGYFGEAGLGLQADEQNPCCVYFEGGGGFVRVTAGKGEKRTEVELETREWDYQVKQFLHEIG